MIYQEPIGRSEYTATGFRGLAKGTAFGSIDSFADTLNMSGADYPAVRVRDMRAEVHDYGNTNGTHVAIADGGDGLIHITGKKVYYRRTQIATLPQNVGSTEQILVIGKKMLLRSMGVVVDLTIGTVAAVAQSNTQISATAVPCDIDGNAGQANVSVYAKITGTGLASGLNQGDVITIASSNSLDAVTDGDYQIIKKISDSAIVVIAAMTVSTVTASGTSFTRQYPTPTFACVCGNRIWACDNGSSRKGQIYCSALGDPFNWNTFQGLSTDSWVSAVGTPGMFTWACSFQDTPIFFKENEIIKVYGSTPSEFQISVSQAPGVERGYNQTLDASVCMDGTLYYRSGEGIMAYDGATPVRIDQALGTGQYTRARFGAGHGKLYVCMTPLKVMNQFDTWETQWQNGYIEPELYVYDTHNGTWYREDSLEVARFVTSGYGDLYALEHYMDESRLYDYHKLWAIDLNQAHGGATYPKMVEGDQYLWLNYSGVYFALETGRIELEKLYRKHAAKLKLRFEYYSQVQQDPPPMLIEAAYDEGNWQTLKQIDSKNSLMMETVTLIPTRCDYMRLRISGRGYLKLHEIAFIDENGSEL